MTKLPQTIRKTVNILTGEESPLGSIYDGRCSGRTLSIALNLISAAMSSTNRHAFSIDHAGYERRFADNLLHEVLGVISHLKLLGFKAEVRNVDSLRGYRGLSGVAVHAYGYDVYGVFLQWNQVQEVFYDLRK